MRSEGLENIVMPSQEAIDQYMKLAYEDAGGVLKFKDDSVLKGITWKCGEIEWEGFMRELDQQV